MQDANPHFDALAKRIGELERDNRRLKYAGVGFAALFATLVLMGQSAPAPQTPSTIQADEIVVGQVSIRKNGVWVSGDREFAVLSEVGVWHHGPSGGTASLSGESGLHVEASGGEISMMGGFKHDGFPTLGPSIRLEDAQGETRCEIELVGNDGTPKLTLSRSIPAQIVETYRKFFFPATSQPTASQPTPWTAEKLAAYTRYWEAQDKARAVEIGCESDAASISLIDSTGKARTVLGSVSLVAPKTGVQETRPLSSIVLFGPDGNVLWEVP